MSDIDHLAFELDTTDSPKSEPTIIHATFENGSFAWFSLHSCPATD